MCVSCVSVTMSTRANFKWDCFLKEEIGSNDIDMMLTYFEQTERLKLKLAHFKTVCKAAYPQLTIRDTKLFCQLLRIRSSFSPRKLGKLLLIHFSE